MTLFPVFVNAGKGHAPKDLTSLANGVMSRLKESNHPGISLVVSYGVETSIALSHGWARRPDDTPSLPMSEHVRYDLCSVSKPLTAAGILRILLDRKDVSLDSAIAPFLPWHWKVHESRAGTTFRHLLTHTSGMKTEARRYSDVRANMAEPIEGKRGEDHYCGANYTLLRIMFGTLSFPGLHATLTTDEMGESVTSALYFQLMQNLVFRPAGVSEATLLGSTEPGLGYAESPNYGEGVEFGDGTATAGGSGWHLTCAEASRVFRVLHASDAILPKAWARKMGEEALGYDRKTGQIDDVTWFSKGGHLPKNGADIKTRILCFSNGVRMMVYVNTGAGDALKSMTDQFQIWYST